jgi:uncharacterized oxidoreductase
VNISNNKILITGGATGIGLGLTQQFLKENNTIIICGRRAEALEAVALQHPSVITRVCDLAIESERIALYNWISSTHPDTNVLVNNAGIQNWMTLDDAHFYEKAQLEITTNVLAPIHLAQLFMQMPAINTIINVTSGLSFVPLTKVPVYSATKAFFHSFTLSLQHLLKAKHIEVIEIIPPALNTDLGGKGLNDTAPPVSAFVESIFAQLRAGSTTLTFGFSEMMANGSAQDLKNTFNHMNAG